MSGHSRKTRGRGGRPAIPQEQVRRRTIGVRVNAEELNRLQEKAGRMNMAPAQWLRHAALDRMLPPCPAPELNRAMYMELGRIGSNLNQLVKASHSGHASELAPILQELLKTIQSFRLQLLGVPHDSQAD